MGLTGFNRWRRLKQKQEEETRKEKKEQEKKAEKQESSIDKENELLLAVYEAACKGDITASGKPSVQAVEKILGWDISAADRDRAWEIVKKEFEK